MILVKRPGDLLPDPIRRVPVRKKREPRDVAARECEPKYLIDCHPYEQQLRVENTATL